MAYDRGLAQRVREVLVGRPGISERAMFGGLAFLVDGKMFVGIRNSSLMARVGPERHDDALAMPNVRAMDFTGRPMKGLRLHRSARDFRRSRPAVMGTVVRRVRLPAAAEEGEVMREVGRRRCCEAL